MYITVTNDDNKYYRTWSSGKTKIDGCTNVIFDKIPEDNDITKQRFYKFITTVTKETIQQQKIGEDGLPMYEMIEEQAIDENGNPQFETIIEDDKEVQKPVMITIPGSPIMEDVVIENTSYSWEFDEEAYNQYIKEQSEIIPEKTDSEKIEDLTKQLQEANSMINDLSLMVMDLSINNDNV